MRAGIGAAGRQVDGWPRGEPVQLTLLPMTPDQVKALLLAGSLRAGDLRAVGEVEARCPLTIPLMLFPASCGFPSPADDYLDAPLDFNELLVANPAATFAVKIAGDSMKNAGIFPGDVAIVDRSLTAWNGCIVVALLDGEFTVKRYRLTAGGIVLEPENRKYQPIPVGEDADFQVWGVVRNTIRML